jgi:predicted AlkP superfamily pyrophosphatase or phosphodiesterase
MRPLIVLNVVGLARRFIGRATPNIARLAARGGLRNLATITPAVTCTVQSTMLTGLRPDAHGIVGNGWYFRDLGEVFLWRQSNRLVAGEKVWDAAKRRESSFTCANLFWWYAMHASTDIAVTPRPIYRADGRKIPDIWSSPSELRDELTRLLGPFPLFHFWGPGADIRSSRWIADAALHVLRTRAPTLMLIYLPHLDYVFQRHGPAIAAVGGDLAAIDAVCGDILAEADRIGVGVLLLSEYGITEVSRPVHVNRVLREAGWLRVRQEMGCEQLDVPASDVFAVADHQIAHVYVRRPELLPTVAARLSRLPGVAQVLDAEGKRSFALDHPRAGELVLLAETDSWFTWYHWLNDSRAPDFARTVEIHRKPGYDPVELFLDPRIRFPRAAVGWRLAKRALGFRSVMDVIPLDATLVRGSHGRVTRDAADGPVLIGSEPSLLPPATVSATAVKGIILRNLFPGSGEG